MAVAKTMNDVTSSVIPNGSFTETAPRLDGRFAALNRQATRNAVIASYDRLKNALAREAVRIGQELQSAIPEVEWSDVVRNGYLPLTDTI